MTSLAPEYLGAIIVRRYCRISKSWCWNYWIFIR